MEAVKKSLDELAIKYGTDKSSEGHNYCVLYEKHLPNKINKLLEIGVWTGQGIKMFKEWYNHEGMFYALDRFIDGYGLITISELQALGINAYEGSQDEMWFLETIKEKFTVLIDDGSHHFDSQINTFKRMFTHNVEPEGWYICEDVFDEQYWGRGIITDPTQNLMGAFRKYLNGGGLITQMISQQESDLLCSQIEEVHLYKDIIFVKKKLNA